MASMGSNEKTTVFQSREGEIFRIPALYYNNNEKKLFAFAEKRTTADDATSVALVMSEGTVDIDTATKKKTVKWSLPEEVVKKCSCGYRPMNPCAVYEKHTQTLFLFFIYVIGTEGFQIDNHWNKARLWYVTKKSDNKWSEVTEVTDVLPEMKHWSTFAIGPGHGIQTESGRMIVPAYAYTGPENEKAAPHAFCFYSDDYGKTWRCSKMLSEASIECQVAEIYDSKGHSLIYCNARSQGGYRVQAEIDDRGFHAITPVTPLVETGGGCEGSVISFPAQSGEPNTKWLLFCHPTNPKERLDLGVYRNNSPLNSNENCSGAWSKPWVINKGPSGYSDLAYIEDGWFACLMERGEKTYTEEIACFLFYDDLILQI
ncbi:sialidase-3-like [Xiphophorus couchianus]|uniref:sialidase-3-like n=1 Tax=Xiphophorus couchianus TaxID=32473 RepID=UPI001015F1E4|nr:sialidase-3-like [Xiphophorus couchianus]